MFIKYIISNEILLFTQDGQSTCYVNDGPQKPSTNYTEVNDNVVAKHSDYTDLNKYEMSSYAKLPLALEPAK